MDFKDWHSYYANRQDHFDHIEFPGEMELDGYEEAIVASSIQQFQMGENSDGKHLKQLAKKMKDEHYTKAMEGLIREEQNHALALGRFMEQEKIPFIEEHWLDSIFKRIIKTPSLAFTIMILLAAETVATVFYNALARATHSKTLKAICSQILVDEAMHVRFQVEALQQFYNKYGAVRRTIFRHGYTLMMLMMCLVVWFQYRKVFKAGGLNFKTCNHALMHEFGKSMRMIIGKERVDYPAYQAAR